MEATDIDEAFDNLVLAEEIEVEKGYKDGYQTGAREAEATGLGLGFQRAAEVASEVGFYEGFVVQADATLSAADSSDPAVRQLRRARPLLLALRRLVSQLPRHNTTDGDVTALLDAVRAKFRQLCAVLKVNPGSGVQQKEISF